MRCSERLRAVAELESLGRIMRPEFVAHIPAIALCISLLSLFVSGANLGWNIYRELSLRARLRIKFQLSSIHHPTFPEPHGRFTFSVTNFGPGKIKITMLHLRDVRLWRRLLRRCRYAALMHDYEHPLGGKLPQDLEVGQGADITFPRDVEFMRNGFTHIGIADSFGRLHWCKLSDMKQALKDLK